jgi:hypothetical protein
MLRLQAIPLLSQLQKGVAINTKIMYNRCMRLNIDVERSDQRTGEKSISPFAIAIALALFCTPKNEKNN